MPERNGMTLGWKNREEGGIGGPEHRNTAKKIVKYRNTSIPRGNSMSSDTTTLYVKV